MTSNQTTKGEPMNSAVASIVNGMCFTTGALIILAIAKFVLHFGVC